MAYSQMNIRIDAETKASGDAVLAEVGFTPTDAVRTLWQFASANGGNLNRVRAVLDEMTRHGSDAELRQERRARAFRSIGHINEQTRLELGLAQFPPPGFFGGDIETDRQALGTALIGNLDSKGLW